MCVQYNVWMDVYGCTCMCVDRDTVHRRIAHQLESALMNIHEGSDEDVVRKPAVGVVTPPTALSQNTNTAFHHRGLEVKI